MSDHPENGARAKPEAPRQGTPHRGDAPAAGPTPDHWVSQVLQQQQPPPMPARPLVNGQPGSNGASMPTMFDLGRGKDAGIAALVKPFRDTQYKGMFPWREFASLLLLQHKAIRWILFFGFVPFVLMFGIQVTNGDVGFSEIAWVLSAYFCCFWAITFQTLLRPKEPKILLYGLSCTLFTAFVGITLLLLAQKLPFIRTFYSMLDSQNHTIVAQWFGFVFGVGIMEELCKATPILLIAIFGASKMQSIRGYLFLGIMSGLGFALAEGVHYTMQYSESHAIGAVKSVVSAVQRGGSEDEMMGAAYRIYEGYSQMLTIQLVRFASLSLLHASWAGIVGWFIGFSMTEKKPLLPCVIVGVCLCAILHGTYNTFSGQVFKGFFGMTLACLSVVLLMSYIMQLHESSKKPLAR